MYALTRTNSKTLKIWNFVYKHVLHLVMRLFFSWNRVIKVAFFNFLNLFLSIIIENIIFSPKEKKNTHLYYAKFAAHFIRNVFELTEFNISKNILKTNAPMLYSSRRGVAPAVFDYDRSFAIFEILKLW